MMPGKRDGASIHFQRRSSREHEEELLGVMMEVAHLIAAGGDPLLNDAESR